MYHKFDYHPAKSALRAQLYACVNQGMSYEQTAKALKIQFSAACTACDLATMGHSICETGRECFVKKTYGKCLEDAKEMCAK